MIKKEITTAKDEVGGRCDARFDNIETAIGNIWGLQDAVKALSNNFEHFKMAQ
jgi:hypothetical protein